MRQIQFDVRIVKAGPSHSYMLFMAQLAKTCPSRFDVGTSGFSTVSQEFNHRGLIVRRHLLLQGAIDCNVLGRRTIGSTDTASGADLDIGDQHPGQAGICHPRLLQHLADLVAVRRMSMTAAGDTLQFAILHHTPDVTAF